MMASAISQEEFHRLQTQLIDLRTANYTLMEESNRYRNELKNAVSKMEILEKEYHKTQRVLEKSRKAKDVEMLFTENDSLQNKLIAQEEQFREQNQALLQELANLVAANEKLETAAKNHHSAGGDGNQEINQSYDQECQCDLSTECFEKLMNEEKERSESLCSELSSKVNEIMELKAIGDELRESSAKEIRSLKEQQDILKIEGEKVTSLSKQLEDSCKERNVAVTEINLLKQQLDEMEQAFRQEISNLKVEHQLEIETNRGIHAEEIKQLEIQIELAAAQRTEFEEEVTRARQQRDDSLEDVRIAERRRLTDTADLRRQLRSERRRADKLQERLRDFISETSDPSLLPKAETSVDHDNCSVSSWSLMSGQNEANNSATPSSPFPPTDSPSSGSEKNVSRKSSEAEQLPDLASENGRLVSRLAQMQQEKWRLEERVMHLEQTNAAMAEEMVKRGKLIQHYCMEGRANHVKSVADNGALSPNVGNEKLSVRRMVSLIRQIGGDSDGEGVDVQHRRIQRMLEETLTKNMHLQEDIERLSQEVVRLSQIVGSTNNVILPATPVSSDREASTLS